MSQTNPILASVPPEQAARPRKLPFRAIVHSIDRLTYDIRLFRFRLIDPPGIVFRPGQIIRLMVPPYGNNPQPVGRAYSIASLPSESPFLDIMVRLVPGGVCTTWLFNVVQEGDDVTLAGPYGSFGLSAGEGPMIWVAGGSGMGPFWSILRHMIQQGIRRTVTYYFGAVGRDDLVLADELAAVQREHAWFDYVPILSGPAEDDSWPGHRGLVTDVLDRHILMGDASEFYLCGPPKMIDRAKEILHEKSIPDCRVFIDRFTCL
jgi:Na+-transporting NADH:ubiquinone oxidoreductase subunit F